MNLHRFQGVQLDYCNSQTTTLFLIPKIIIGGSGVGRSYLGWLLLVEELGPTVSHSFLSLVPYPIFLYHGVGGGGGGGLTTSLPMSSFLV